MRAAALLLLGSGACLATPVQRVETLGAGHFEASLEGGVAGLEPESPILPSGNLAFRYGVTERLDLGLRVGTQLYELQSKVMLSSREARVPVSFAPSGTFVAGRDPFGGNASDRFAFLWLRLPVLVGFPVGEGHQLVLGPGVNQITGFGEGRAAAVVEPRLSVGFSARLMEGVRLHPEVAAGIGALSYGSDGVFEAGPSLRYTAVVGIAVGDAY